MKKIIFLFLSILISCNSFAQGTYGCIITNKTSNGVLTAGSGCTVDNATILKWRQTTAGITATIPNSSGTVGRSIEIYNDSISGSVSITLSPGGYIPVNRGLRFFWVGNKWVTNGKYLTSSELGLEFTTWNSSISYTTGNVVLYGGMVWRATGSSTNQAPGGGSPWTLEVVNTSTYSESGWSGSIYAPTQDAVRDKIESIQDSIDESIKQGYNVLTEPLILDSNKVGFGGTPYGLAHFVLPNDASPLSKTSWTGVDVVFGQNGLTGKALGVSYTTGTNTINMNFLEPAAQWLNGQLNFAALGFYSGGGALGFYQNQFGQVGINTTNTASGSLLTIRGSDNSDDDYQIRTFNNSGDEIFSLRNDKNIFLNSHCYIKSSTVSDTAVLVENNAGQDLYTISTTGVHKLASRLTIGDFGTPAEDATCVFNLVTSESNRFMRYKNLSGSGHIFDYASNPTYRGLGLYDETNGRYIHNFMENGQIVEGSVSPADENTTISSISNGLDYIQKWVNSTVRASLKNDGEFTASKFTLSALNTAPSSSSDTGTTGEIRIDASYIYICTATDTWKRVAIATW